jgi:NodT family efflux transporter outer membrane factor (OMF) lipoprotein
MKKYLCLSLAFVLSACSAVGPNYLRPEAKVPQTFTEKGGSAPLRSNWWEEFHDPALNALVAGALDGSPDLMISQARLRQARAVQGIQDAASGPTVDFKSGVSRDRISKNSEILANLPIKNVTTEFTNYQVNFDASWEVDLFGHQRRLSEGARARVEASAELVQDAQLVLVAEVVRNYIELRMWQHRLVLGKQNLGYYQELVRLARLSYQAGDGTKLDVQRAESNHDNFASTLPGLELGVRQSLAALSVLTGSGIDELDVKLASSAQLFPVPAVPAVGLPSELLKRRPDVRSAERELAAASADIGVSVAELYPRFYLVGNAGWASVHPGSLLDSASLAWSVGPQLSFPIFNKGRLKSQVKANEAAFDVALASYRKSVLSAVSDVDVALSRVARNEEKHGQLREAEKELLEISVLTGKQMKAGEVSKVAVLEARRNLANQEDQTLQAQAQSLTAMISLYKALGGGLVN